MMMTDILGWPAYLLGLVIHTYWGRAIGLFLLGFVLTGAAGGINRIHAFCTWRHSAAADDGDPDHPAV